MFRSLVFHVGDEWLEYFYPGMKPWIHYIPVPSKASEKQIYYLIQFARDNPDVAKKIADAGADFIKDHLRMRDVNCYWRKLIKSYTKLLNYKVVRDPKLKLVKNVHKKSRLHTEL